jgi:flavin reductase (DIM6/NTAB) family NADH-FMN oxidoreductase RutF
MSEAATIRNVLERIPYGIFVIATTSRTDGLRGIIATWVTQLSFEPPLVAVSVEKKGDLADALRRSGQFSLSLVPATGLQVAKNILKAGSHLNGPEVFDAFTGPLIDPPILRDSSGALICQIQQVVDTGDHDLFIAEVVKGIDAGMTPALTLRETGWKYRRRTP